MTAQDVRWDIAAIRRMRMERTVANVLRGFRECVCEWEYKDRGMVDPQCARCGILEELACEIEATTGCRCDPGVWDGEIPPPCKRYVREMRAVNRKWCATCEHNEACHQ